jgi:hypothetical protein
MRHLLLPLCVSLLAGCAATTNYYTPTVESWRGGNVDTLVQRWGTPDVRSRTSDGNVAYLYQTASYHNNAGPSSPQIGVNYTPGGRPNIITQDTNFAASRGGITYNCLTTFVANRQGKIVRVEEQGHGCYGNAGFANSKSNPNSK